MPPEPTLPEREVDFRISFRDKKTIQEVNNDLEKHWGSKLDIVMGWGVMQLEATYFIIEVQLEENESVNNLLNDVTWPELCILVTTHLKKRLPDQN